MGSFTYPFTWEFSNILKNLDLVKFIVFKDFLTIF